MNPMDREREIEQWMSAALGQYGNVEPRTGLENRVLTNLQSERNRLASQRRWWWATGTVAAAAAIVATVWWGEFGIGRVPAKTVTVTVAHQESTGVPEQPMHPSQDDGPKQIRRPRVEMQPRRDSDPVRAPKLEQFPSPAPMNAQEKMLALYVQEFPQRAALIARTQTDLRKQNEREMGAPWPRDAESTGSDQQQ